MARAEKSNKSTRKRYSDEFKTEALALAQSVGVAQAAREPGVHASQLYGWRSKHAAAGSQSDTERKQAVEIARLKRQVAGRDEELAILKKAAAYFAKRLK